jgi:glycosyltransferase involved in cell wall biosynthesis
MHILHSAQRQSHTLFQPDTDIAFRNREGFVEYDFVLPARVRASGVTAMLRVKNESRKIGMCLSSALHLFDEIVVVDNASSDDTLQLVEQFKADHDREGRVQIYSYPHSIARCGDEHWETPEDSIHSLVYYYNWCRSKCRCGYFFKWDADMALAKNATQPLLQLFSTLNLEMPTIYSFPLQTVYRTGSDWYLAQGEVNKEPRLAPNRSAVRFRKARYWEQLESDIAVGRRDVARVYIYELKDVSEDEFSHWTPCVDFPTERKRREWTNFQLVKCGELGGGVFERLRDDFLEHLPADSST